MLLTCPNVPLILSIGNTDLISVSHRRFIFITYTFNKNSLNLEYSSVWYNYMIYYKCQTANKQLKLAVPKGNHHLFYLVHQGLTIMFSL